MLTVIRDSDGNVIRAFGGAPELNEKLIINNEKLTWTERQCRKLREMSIELKYKNK